MCFAGSDNDGGMRLEGKRQCAEGKRQLWGRGQRGGRANAPAAGNGERSQAIICQAVDVKQAEPIVKAYKEAWVPLIAFNRVFENSDGFVVRQLKGLCPGSLRGHGAGKTVPASHSGLPGKGNGRNLHM